MIEYDIQALQLGLHPIRSKIIENKYYYCTVFKIENGEYHYEMNMVDYNHSGPFKVQRLGVFRPKLK